MNFKSGDLVRFRNPDSIHGNKILSVIMDLEPVDDDCYQKSGVNYLLRTDQHKKVTAYHCELISVELMQRP